MREEIDWLDNPTTYQQYMAFEQAMLAYCLESTRHPDSIAFFRSTFNLMSPTEFHYFLHGMPKTRRDQLLRAYALGFERWLEERVKIERRTDAQSQPIDVDEIHRRIHDLLSVAGHSQND